MNKRTIFFVFHFVLVFVSSVAQEDSTYHNFGDFGGIVYLDSLTVTASKNGFQVNDFIDLVQNDESFYKAFSNIRRLSYYSENDFIMFDKKAREKASYKSEIQQISDGDCRNMKILKEESSGNFYKKNKKYRYYTARVFDKLFMTHGKVCESHSKSAKGKKTSAMDKHIAELKKLIFKPGSKADVPFIGKKTAIFAESMIQYYDISIKSSLYKNEIPCYFFTAQIKDEFLNKKKDKTVIKFLRTYFDKENFQVLGREYMLNYAAALFDFDVKIEIDLMRKGAFYLPKLIKYDGKWDIPGRKPEISKFSISFREFR